MAIFMSPASPGPRRAHNGPLSLPCAQATGRMDPVWAAVVACLESCSVVAERSLCQESEDWERARDGRMGAGSRGGGQRTFWVGKGVPHVGAGTAL